MLDLDRKGYDQALHAGHELSRMGFRRIYVSPIPYAIKTAHEVATLQRIGRPEIIPLPELVPSNDERIVRTHMDSVMKRIMKEHKGEKTLIISHRVNAKYFLESLIGKLFEWRDNLATLEHGEWARRTL